MVMSQMKVAVSDQTKAYLEEQAQKNGRNLSKEVRVRLDQSAVDGMFDAATNDFARDVMWLAKMVSTDGATWCTDEKRFQALRVAIDKRLTFLADRLDLKPLSKIAIDPESFGTAIAQAYEQMGLLKHKPGGDNMGSDDDE
jgi:TraY domain-containing protein